MGGGSGGGWNTLGNISALEEKAKRSLQGGKRNVFISFSSKDMDEVDNLRESAKDENSDIEFNDHSVRVPYKSERAEYIKQKITERIERCSICVVHISDNAAQSRWVKWEVETSLSLGKTVIVTHTKGGKPSKMPEWISKNGLKVVTWSSLPNELK